MQNGFLHARRRIRSSSAMIGPNQPRKDICSKDERYFLGKIEDICSKIDAAQDQPSRAVLLVRMFCLLSHRTRQSARVLKPRSRGTLVSPRTLRTADPRRGANDPIRSDCLRRRLSPSSEEDIEEAATPGVPQESAMTHLWKPSSSSPSRTTGTASLFAICGSALEQLTHALAGTVLEKQILGNRNLTADCAEAVEDGNSLWKAKEKTEKIATDLHG